MRAHKTYQPLSLINEFQNEINQLLQGRSTHLKQSTLFTGEGNWMPEVDIEENEKQYLIKANIPGVDPKDLEITLVNNILTLKGKTLEEHQEQGKNFVRTERLLGTFQRSFSLPDMSNDSNIEAKTKNGVLTLIIPKSKKSETKKIKVKHEE